MHLIDQPLFAILRRLRQASADGRSKVNKLNISIPFERYGSRVAPTGHALKLAIESACGNEAHAYIARKKKQLDTLGYGQRPISGRMTIKAKDAAELVDVYLGLRGNVDVSEFQVFETRFGIPIPRFAIPESGRITIQPHPVDTCVISIRTGRSAAPIVFRGELFLPAIQKVPIEAMKALIKSDLFKMLLFHEGYSFDADYDAINKSQQPVEVWASMSRLRLALAKGNGKIEIASASGLFRWSAPLLKIGSLDQKESARLVAVCDHLVQLFKRAGVIPIPEVTMQEIIDNWDDIVSVSALATGRVNSASAELIPIGASLEGVHAMKGVYADFLSVGSITLAAIARCHVALRPLQEHIGVLLTKFHRIEVRSIRAYQDYLALKAELNSTGNMVILRRELLSIGGNDPHGKCDAA